MTTVEFEQKPPLEPDTGKLAAPPLPEHNHLDAAYCHFTAEDIDQLRSNAEQGNSDAMICLSACCRDGIGTRKDTRESMRWVRRALKKNEAALK